MLSYILADISCVFLPFLPWADYVSSYRVFSFGLHYFYFDWEIYFSLGLGLVCHVTHAKSKHNHYRSDVEIVGQPVSEADRKFFTVQKVLRDSSFLWEFLLKVLKTMIISARKYDMS